MLAMIAASLLTVQVYTGTVIEVDPTYNKIRVREDNGEIRIAYATGRYDILTVSGVSRVKQIIQIRIGAKIRVEDDDTYVCFYVLDNLDDRMFGVVQAEWLLREKGEACLSRRDQMLLIGLGNDRYSVREASNRLIKDRYLPLLVGLKSKDAEVKSRCRELLRIPD